MIDSAEEFVRLRTSENREEYSIAAEGEAPMSVWLDIVAHYPDMKAWVVHNRTVPLEILELLAVDQDRDVRMAVAHKRKLSLELFNLLSRDIDEMVRQRVAYNKKAPVSVLMRLSEDKVALVRDAAKKRLSSGSD